AELEHERDVALAKVVGCRVRYFTDGVIIGSKGFVNEVFAACRDRFGAGRKDGARRMRGAAQAVNRELWSARDLRKGIG
ncbi:MAG: hypothetical protein NTW21_22405, partial [Verrucomicrobia bacterium]|nr:hypothetical protein [Verrucomicrobiota bacterium]